MEKAYTPTIGLEIHAELKTKSKMFCSCVNDPHNAEPNVHICPVCTAQPGSLPVVNRQAVENVLKVGTAVGSTIADFTEFDRKNYFYPDIPKAYQISQYKFPLVKGGMLNGVTLNRIHLEEDTARSQHDQTEGSVVDFNRAGVPLMELVTEPEMHDAKSASSFARELQLLLRTLGVSDANMERGEMRVEANISVSSTDVMSDAYVEVKNINSFKAVEGAIEYEVRRQIQLIENGETIKKETRGWDEHKARTVSQRSKETAHDYRYFPDPDITKYKLDEIADFNKSSLNEKMPVLPNKNRDSWANLGIKTDTIEVIISDLTLTKLFVDSLNSGGFDDSTAVLLSNYVSSDVQSLLQQGVVPHSAAPEALGKLIGLVSGGTINSRVAKDLLPEVIEKGTDPAVLAEEQGLTQESSPEALQALVDEIISEQDAVVSDYKAGKEAALKFLVGQGMKKSKGTANPGVLEQLLKDSLA